MTDKPVNLESVRHHVEILQWVNKRMAELKTLVEDSRPAVEEALGSHEVGILDGLPVVTFKHLTSNRLDQKQVKEHYPEIAEKCMTTTNSRRFEVL
jgi:predicted phage-related endonuclease